MLQSEHYGLKLVEGSDIVNPLVIDRPNYETIDGVMYGNESQAIGNATELKSGTIHAINRSKGNQRFFIFTATSNYELGDTFTVDSVPVTALMPNGTALPNMAYVVNGTVLCSLVGTLLTVYTVGSALADDSLRLGGELPAYYAKQSDLTATDTLARGASTLSLANEQAIRELNNKKIKSDTVSGTTHQNYGVLISDIDASTINILNASTTDYFVSFCRTPQNKYTFVVFGVNASGFELAKNKAVTINYDYIDV